jgi:hypothetical protein
VTGELPACQAAAAALGETDPDPNGSSVEDEKTQAYLNKVVALYEWATERMTRRAPDLADAMDLQMKLFDEMVAFNLGPDFPHSTNGSRLKKVRMIYEEERIGVEEKFLSKRKIDDFVDSMNALTERFQNDVTRVLTAPEYRALLELEPGETVVLGDPEIARKAYERLIEP